MADTMQASGPTTTVGRYLVHRLAELGLRHAFGVPGDYVLDLMDRFVESEIKLVNTCNELNAGYAADAYARLRGVGCVVVTYDVGGFSTVNAIAGAYAERVPVVVVSGAPHSAQSAKRALMHHLATDFNLQREIFAKITVDTLLITSGESAPDEIDRVLRACMTQKRPVYVEIPVDAVDLPCRSPKPLKLAEEVPSNADALREAVQETLEMIGRADRPAILAGVELQRFGLSEEFDDLLHKSGIPYATTGNGKSVLPEEGEQFVGVFQGALSRPEVRRLVEGSDCLICLGAWLHDITTLGVAANMDENRMISANSDRVKIRHHYYDQVSLKDYVRTLCRRIGRHPFVFDNPEGPHRPDPDFTLGGDAELTVKSFFEAANHFLEDDMIVVADAGDALFSASELHVGAENFVAQSYYLSIGYTVPATLGLSLARPDKRVVLFVGDGSFQMTAQAVSTIIRNGCTPVVFLLNNDGYVIERVIHDGPYNDIQSWDYAALPKVFGDCLTLEVTTEDELADALDQAKATRDKLVFVEVHLPRTDCSEALVRLGKEIRKMSSSSRDDLPGETMPDPEGLHPEGMPVTAG